MKKLSNFHIGKYCTVFKDGKLYTFTPSSVVVLNSWPNPKCWVKTNPQDWHMDRKSADSMKHVETTTQSDG